MSGTMATSRDDRDFLKAVVALHLAGKTPVDGASDPREFVEAEWVDAYETTKRMVECELLRWADPDAQAHMDDAYTLVVPTALGVFEALLS